jgi:3-hydroxyisobutyrate dehydrogenase-like beta-hydroxyacid dehydrogenase
VKQRIAVLGIGLMGRGMARRLVGAGHDVRVWNRTRAKAEDVAGAGATLAATPAEAAAGANAVVLMLADPAAVRDVAEGPEGFLSALDPGAVVIDSSTVSLESTVWLAEHARGRDAALLDAPVFGSKDAAEKGELGFMVGGDAAVIERALPLLERMGTRIFHVGPTGSGTLCKLVFNLVVATTLEAWNEGMVLAAKAGLDLDRVLEVILGGRARAGIIEMKSGPVLRRDFTPFFPVRLMAKDLGLALDAGKALGVPMPAVAATLETLASAARSGDPEEDFSAGIKVLERQAGVVVASRRRD